MKHVINKAGRKRLVSSNLKSSSLKLLAQGLSKKLGYKVLRSSKPHPHRLNLRYGDLKNKIEQYQWFDKNLIPSPPWTLSKEVAKQWASNEGRILVCRTLTRASEGRGIVLAETPEQVVNAPVYTLYMKKKKEFRVHIYKDQIVHVLEKRKRAGVACDSKVRNTANGYVFCSEAVAEPEGLRELALKASKVTQSDFKGVDIGYNEKKNELFVIEVNSAPGIMGTNVSRYIDAITNN
jgi:glutathione synthase/RimK-type ligase-like ATP-grasp enzyme